MENKKKTLLLSSAGLKNIITDVNNEGNEFCFIFGGHEVRMSKIFADFISPLISRLHYSDPTLTTYEYPKDDSISDVFTENVLQHFKRLSHGEQIEINEEEIIKLQKLSILLCNDELLNKLERLKSKSFNLEYAIDFFVSQDYLNKFGNYKTIDLTNFIEEISRNFYSISKEKLKKLPLTVLYSIISHPDLRVTDEDSLFIFINEIFEFNQQFDKLNEIDITSFYDEVQFENLSSKLFQEFFDSFDIDQMTRSLWFKIKNCFFLQSKNFNLTRYTSDKIEYKRKKESFNGIINQFIKECNGDLSSKVKVTSSSININHPERLDKYVLEFDNKLNFFQSSNIENSWLKYDFLNRKISLSSYSIKTRTDEGEGWHHLTNWVLEGSNSDNDNDWMILDVRENFKLLDGAGLFHNFKVNGDHKNEFFRYIRIRQTGLNSAGYNYLTVKAIEFFGSITFD